VSEDSDTIDYDFVCDCGRKHTLRVRVEIQEPEQKRVSRRSVAKTTKATTTTGKRLGRPRKDGLPPGSPEAKAADRQKRSQYQRARRKAARQDVKPQRLGRNR
jgi:hypothetical protein